MKSYQNPFKDVCEDGYFEDFDGNCTDLEECIGETHTCSDNMLCKNTPGAFVCYCKAGFNATEGNCTDIDECLAGTFFCPKASNCENTEGSYECKCFEGYGGKNCGDLDECSNGRDQCDQFSRCENTKGSYTCVCNEGYFDMDGSCVFNCHDDMCSENEECDSLTSYECRCKAGFSRTSTGNCADVNECFGENDCDANAKCQNTIGSFSCSCNVGFYGTGKYCSPGQCHDGSCPDNQKCVSPTSIDCECKPGYTKLPSNVCADIDECKNEHECDANAECLNTAGSYECRCKAGFVGHGKSCLAGQCAASAFCDENQECVSPNGVDCKCKAGFIEDDKGACVDTNECAVATSCPKNSVCKNNKGSYSCVCTTGYSGENCDDIDECSTNQHSCDYSDKCENTEGSFTCKEWLFEIF